MRYAESNSAQANRDAQQDHEPETDGYKVQQGSTFFNSNTVLAVVTGLDGSTFEIRGFGTQSIFTPHVVVLNDDNPMHVPMSLRARTSALDVWLAVIKRD